MRNYRCHKYDACLAEAAKADEITLPCRRCDLSNDRGGRANLDEDLPGVIALLLVVLAGEAGSGKYRTSTVIDGIHSRLSEFAILLTGRRPGHHPSREKTSTETIMDQEACRRG